MLYPCVLLRGFGGPPRPHLCPYCLLTQPSILSSVQLDDSSPVRRTTPIFTESISRNHAFMYILLTKRGVKMAGYWPSSLFAFLWTETKSRSIKTQKENEAKIQPS